MEKKFNHHRGAYLDHNGARIYYEVTGNPTGPALLFLHGGFGNLNDATPILAGLSNDYKLVGIESRGHGQSSRDEQPLTYELLQRDVEAVLNHLKIDKMTIIGFSDGGIVAYRLAAFTTLTIDKIITIGSRGYVRHTDVNRANWMKLTGDVMQNRQPIYYEAYQQLNPVPDFDRLIKDLVAMWLDPTAAGHPNEAIKTIACPVLIVRGDEDILLPREAAFDVARDIPDSKLLNIPFANHAAFTDQSEVFLSIANMFLTQPTP